jgi:D-lactate dehydrogenase (cytochrome)
MFGKSKLLQVQACLMLSDCSVPISKLPQLVYETKQDLQRLGLVSIIVGHVGDG